MMRDRLLTIKHLSYQAALLAYAERVSEIGVDAEDAELAALQARIADHLVRCGGPPESAVNRSA